MGSGWEDDSPERGPLDHLSHSDSIADGHVCPPLSPTMDGIYGTFLNAMLAITLDDGLCRLEAYNIPSHVSNFDKD